MYLKCVNTRGGATTQDTHTPDIFNVNHLRNNITGTVITSSKSIISSDGRLMLAKDTQEPQGME
jgi:hypothetical protein